jgi:hypothetical protein
MDLRKAGADFTRDFAVLMRKFITRGDMVVIALHMERTAAPAGFCTARPALASHPEQR